MAWNREPTILVLTKYHQPNPGDVCVNIKTVRGKYNQKYVHPRSARDSMLKRHWFSNVNQLSNCYHFDDKASPLLLWERCRYWHVVVHNFNEDLTCKYVSRSLSASLFLTLFPTRVWQCRHSSRPRITCNHASCQTLKLIKYKKWRNLCVGRMRIVPM